LKRREFIGAALALPWLRLAQAAPVPRTLIDVHHHVRPPTWLAAWESQRGFPSWSAAQSVELMDEFGVAAAALSVTMPFIWLPNQDIEGSRRLTRECNDYMADYVARYPSRFGFFGALPLPDTEGSFAEIEYVLDKQGADGVSLVSQFDGRYLGDPGFAPVFEELNRRRAVIYVHPNAPPPCCDTRGMGDGVAGAEVVFETTRTILSLLYSGSFGRYPQCRFIFSHGGGTIPFVAGRLTRRLRMTEEGRKAVPEGPDAVLQRLYFDTATVTNPGAWGALTAFTSPDKILFGSDAPFAEMSEGVAGLHEMEQRFQMQADDIAAIEHRNAAALLPRLAARMKPAAT
jgi:predicted TIM-barrel fold metal-dependent hydrolase